MKSWVNDGISSFSLSKMMMVVDIYLQWHKSDHLLRRGEALLLLDLLLLSRLLSLRSSLLERPSLLGLSSLEYLSLWLLLYSSRLLLRSSALWLLLWWWWRCLWSELLLLLFFFLSFFSFFFNSFSFNGFSTIALSAICSRFLIISSGSSLILAWTSRSLLALELDKVNLFSSASVAACCCYA